MADFSKFSPDGGVTEWNVKDSNAQPKNLSTPLAIGGIQQTTVEGALSALNEAGGGGEVEMGSLINITFESEFVGATWTLEEMLVPVFGDPESYTGIVPASRKVTVKVKQCNKVYRISASYENKVYYNEVVVDKYFGIYNVTLYAYHIYGVEWDGTSTTTWSRTDDAEYFTDPVPYVAGATEYGSPFDNIYPWAGMTKQTVYVKSIRDRVNHENVFVNIPKFWYKLSQPLGEQVGLKIQICDKPLTAFGFSPAPVFVDRGDGNGERDSAMIARYLCGRYKYVENSVTIIAEYAGESRTGLSLQNASQTQPNLNTIVNQFDDDIWGWDYSMLFTIQLLYLVEFANWDSQRKIGLNLSPGSDSKTGATDTMPYHTGTTAEHPTVTGSIQYRNIEALWNACHLNGIFLGNTIATSSKEYDPDADWDTTGTSSEKGIIVIYPPAWILNDTEQRNYGKRIGIPYSSSTYDDPTKFKINNNVFPKFLAIADKTATGTNSTYTTDEWDYGAKSVRLSNGSDHRYGLFGLYGDSSIFSSSSPTSTYVRMMYFPPIYSPNN